MRQVLAPVAPAQRKGGGPVAGSDLSPEARRAWETTFFNTHMPHLTPALLADARESVLRAGESAYRVDRGSSAVLAVVVDGLLRVYTTSENGRQVTVRYVGASETYGLPMTIDPGLMRKRIGLGVQAVVNSRILSLSPRTFRTLVERDAIAAQAIQHELVHGLLDAYEMLSANVFLPVRMRIARHLLDLAVEKDGAIVVHASQQNIADAIGSVREVVSRAMLRLRDDGLITRSGDHYVILDAAALHDAATTDSTSHPGKERTR